MTRKTLGKKETEVVNFKVGEDQIEVVDVSAVQYGAKLTVGCYAAPQTTELNLPLPQSIHSVVFEKRICVYNGRASYLVTVDGAPWYSFGGGVITDEDRSVIRAFNEAWAYYQTWVNNRERNDRARETQEALNAARSLFDGGA